MAPRTRRSTVLARVLTPVVALAATVSLPHPAGAYVAWGTVLVPGSQWAGSSVAALGDLNVYSNGDGSEDRSTTYGLSYECVELAQRFAAVRFGEQKIWPVDYAYQMWTAGPKLAIPFVQHPNGGGDPPQAGDLIVFDHVSSAPFGHVAVVADTGPGYVDVVEQNWNNTTPTGTARLTISGTTMPARNTMPVLGWLRSSTAAAPFKPVLVSAKGAVYGDAGATTYGGTASMTLARPMVGAAATVSGKGYWMVAGDGGIFPFGDALQHSYGSTGNIHLNQPIVGMAPTASGNGYWLVAADGGIFPFGDAVYHSYGSTGDIHLNQPVVGMARTVSGNGYWLVASDGGIFPFGDALQHSYGSTGGIHLNKPIVGMAPTASGNGYWLVASDGGIFPFGDAVNHSYGSTGNITVPSPIIGMTATTDGNGYWLSTQGGTVYAFGNARYLANTGVVPMNDGPAVGLIATLQQ
jgi:CHAP domain